MSEKVDGNGKYERDRIILSGEDSKFNRLFNPHEKVRENLRNILLNKE